MLMLDRDIIQGRGFRNVVDGDRITGFQFQLRNPNYRGTSASLLDGIDVTIDGEKIPDHLPVWTLQGRTFSLDELRASTDARWQLDETATITVPKPGGLSVGVHDIDVVVYLRRPYFPPMVSRSAFPAQAKRVIVPPVPDGGLRYAVSTYSHSGDLYTSMTLEDVLADTADIGATGIEILGEANVPGYPTPSRGLGRQLARVARDLRAHRHQLRRLGGYRDVARSRPDRRGGSGAASAWICGWHPSSASPRSVRSSVSPRSSWTRTPSGPAPCSVRSTWPRNWTS